MLEGLGEWRRSFSVNDIRSVSTRLIPIRYSTRYLIRKGTEQFGWNAVRRETNDSLIHFSKGMQVAGEGELKGMEFFQVETHCDPGTLSWATSPFRARDNR